jgi:hypothetical protein
LNSVSGELPEKAIMPAVVADYYYLSPHGQIKPVLGTQYNQYIELLDLIDRFNIYTFSEWPVYLMPVGATHEAQDTVSAYVCDLAMRNGWYFSGRLHAYIYNNAFGT